MISGVNLQYDTTFLGAGVKACSNIHVDKVNATVQDVMNIASLYRAADCTQGYPVLYTATYYEGLGNFLTHIVEAGFQYLPHDVNYNTSSEFWHLYVNGNSTSLGMSKQPVSSGDLIQWKFEKTTLD